MAALIQMKTKPGEIPPTKGYNYNDINSWSAIPTGKKSHSNFVPFGEKEMPNENKPADAFFVHPTGYFGSTHWNMPHDDSQGIERRQMQMAGQASAYNISCQMYCPKYRQATLAAYFHSNKGQKENEEAAAIFDLAYQDIKQAFHVYISKHNNGRPFILCSHSQGGHHMQRLLEEEIDKKWSEVKDRFVACYMIGSFIPEERITKTYTNLKLCQGPTESGVVIGWDTMTRTAAINSDNDKLRADRRTMKWNQGRHYHQGLNEQKSLGTNPYTWKTGGDIKPISGKYNKGMINISIKFPYGRNMEAAKDPFSGLAEGMKIVGLKALKSPREMFKAPNDEWFTTQIDPKSGKLIVPDLYLAEKKKEITLPGFAKQTKMGSYHNFDYLFFYENIRQNVKERVEAFIQRSKLSKL